MGWNSLESGRIFRTSVTMMIRVLSVYMECGIGFENKELERWLLRQSCPRVGWTRGVGSGHDFTGFWRVGSGRVGSALRDF